MFEPKGKASQLSLRQLYFRYGGRDNLRRFKIAVLAAEVI
jgi:hypothetical protein